jgi:EmrB/QacA subfamily drug resistance transporter
MRVINVPMRLLLRLPFKTPLNRWLMLLSFTGRKTGRAYWQPVSYVPDGDTLLTPGGGRWKLNLREGEPIRIRLRGHDVSARPEFIRNVEEVERLLRMMMAINPRITSFVPFVGRDGQVDHAKLAAAVGHGFSIIRWSVERVGRDLGVSEHPRRWLALAAMAAAVAIVTLDTTILNVAIPTIRRDLNTDLGSLQWVITGYSLTLGSLLIIGGRIGDLFGVRRAFVTGAVLFAVGSFLASVATSTQILVLGEALVEGIGAALLFPASLATLSMTFQGPARARAFAVWGGVAGAAAALGPVIGGWLTSDFSWRWGFRINVVVAPLAALAALAALPADVGRGRRPGLDLPGVVLAAVGLFLVVFALTEGPDQGWLANRGGMAIGGVTVWSSLWSVSPVVVAVAVAAVALTGFVLFERRKERSGRDPVVDLRLFGSRAFGGGLVTAATVVMAQAGTMFVLAVFLQATHHLTPVSAGRWLLPVGLAVLVGAQIGGRVAGAAGPVKVVRAGILVQLAGVLTAATILRADTGWAALAVALGLFGLGAGLASSQLVNVILSEVPRERAGSASGLATTNNSLGAALGVTILGSVLRAGVLTDAGSARWALLSAAALLVVGSAASFAIPTKGYGNGAHDESRGARATPVVDRIPTTTGDRVAAAPASPGAAAKPPPGRRHKTARRGP